jgi:phosphate starvation-inducible PhoH-like protein
LNIETAKSGTPMLDIHEAASLFGRRDEKVRLIEKELGVVVMSNGHDVHIDGDPFDVEIAKKVVRDLLEVIRQGHRLTTGDVRYSIELAKEGSRTSLSMIMGDVIQVTTRGKKIAPRTLGQKIYLDAMRRRDVVFAIGPAGTGKTYLAMAMAVASLKMREVSKIILTRPVVDAGEKLGFLPGDLQDKVDPYLRPVYDALYDIVGIETFLHQRSGFWRTPFLNRNRHRQSLLHFYFFVLCGLLIIIFLIGPDDLLNNLVSYYILVRKIYEFYVLHIA